MKKFKYIFAAFFMILIACEEDDAPGTVALSNLTVNPEVSSDLPGQVVFRSSASGAKLFKYDFGDGTTGESLSGYIVKSYTEPGQNSYTVTITVTGDDGTTLTETVQVSVDVPATNSAFVNLLTNGTSKTWFLAASQAGHLGVGPSKEGIDGDWWYPKWYSASAFEKCGSEESDCLCDDELTFSVDSSGEVSYVLDNKGQTYFNVAHQGAAGGSGDTDLCYDFDTSGTKSVAISMVNGNVPEAETTGMQLELSDGGFMGYYVGASKYEILELSEDLLYVRTIDAIDPNLAWYHRFTAEVSMGGGDETLTTVFTDLVWSDEFDVDGAPNPANWTYDLGSGGWGNGEAQSYTDDPENVKVEGGMLKITAKGSGESGSVLHYYDDVTLIATGGATPIEDFEGTAPTFSAFGGASTEVIDNPDASGENTSVKVAQSTKPVGAEEWAGSYFDLDAGLDLANSTSISVKTWSPGVGAVVRLKLEDKNSSGATFVEIDANTTVSEAWETLTFDLSAAVPAVDPLVDYDRVVLFFDFGVSPVGDAAYTSARIKSENLYEFTYGRVEIRAKLPSAGGTWPALWALGANFDEVGWPASGEIDIMEHVGNNANVVSSALHYPGNSGGNAVTSSTSVPTATSEFHNYTVEWTADSIKFVVDEELIHTSFVNTGDTPFNSDFFFIMNIAMGGTLGGSIDGAFTEDTMEVDYIRVYQ